MIRAGIFGATGYTGIELIRLLFNHQRVEVTVATSEQYTGLSLDSVLPFLRGGGRDIKLVSKEDALFEEIDVALLALPHTVSMEITPSLLERGVRVIDLSADFRLKDRRVYESTYGVVHGCPDLIPGSVYGICEIYRDEIRKADLVSVPGCFPASVIIPSYPMLNERLAGGRGIVADCKTGVSGGGRAPKPLFHYPEVEGGMMAYGFPVHRHTAEINQELSACSEEEVKVTFIPHLAPMVRGILSTIYMERLEGVDENKIREVYSEYFEMERFVRVFPPGEFPSTRYVSGSNYCDIGIAVRVDTGKVVLTCAIDNLVKGASGSAVQCLNVMFDWDEGAGIDGSPLFP